LIQLRGPKSYNTDFEQALFMAHTVPIITECLFNGYQCFLAQKAWKSVMRSVIVEDALISDRSNIVIELMVLKSNIPGFFVDINNTILSERQPDYAHINHIARKIYQLRVDLLKWHESYEFLLRCAPEMYPGSAEYDRRCKVFATYLSCVIIASRLLGCISPKERVELEEEAQMLAHQMLDLELEVKSTNSAACLFMAQTLGVAQSVIGTSQDWLREEYEGYGDRVDKLESLSPEGFVSPTSGSGSSDSWGQGTSEQKDLIEVWKFKKWNELCGRKTS